MNRSHFAAVLSMIAILSLTQGPASARPAARPGPKTEAAKPSEGGAIHRSTLTPVLHFERLGEEKGLPSMLVTAIVQDSVGFLWVGTEAGLTRFDGYTFVRQGSEASSGDGLPRGVYVTALAADAKGGVWVGTDRWGIYRLANGSVDRLQEKDQLPGNSVTALEIDGDVLWVGTPSGLAKVDIAGMKVTRFQRDVSGGTGPLANEISALERDAEGGLWVGTSAGLSRRDPKSGSFTHFRPQAGSARALAGAPVTSLVAGTDGTIWIGTESNGLDAFTPAKGTFRHYTSSSRFAIGTGRINALESDRGGRIWVGSDEGGVAIYDVANDRFVRSDYDPGDAQSLSHTRVLAIHADTGGVVWIGTFADLNKFDPWQMPFSFWRTGPPGSFALDLTGKLWIGSRAGLIQLDRKTGDAVTYPYPAHEAGRNIRAVDPSPLWVPAMAFHQGSLWLATLGRGLLRFHPENGSFDEYLPSEKNEGAIESDQIVSLLATEQGDLWIGTWGGGLAKYDRASDGFSAWFETPARPSKGPASNHIYTISQDRRNAKVLWIGTAHGLSRFDVAEGSFNHFHQEDQGGSALSSNEITSIYQDKDLVLWVGTLGGGLNRMVLGGEGVRVFRAKDGLPSDIVYAIYPEGDTTLWMATTAGISTLDVKAGTFLNYNWPHNAHFAQGAHYKSPSGELFWGGQIDGALGFVAFEPRQVHGDDYVPPTVFTSFKVLNEPISIDPMSPSKQWLSATRSIFTIEFAALAFADSARNRYRYRLKGLDDNWIETKDRSVPYNRPPPGDYVFEVQGSNRHGVFAKNAATIPLVLQAPPWRSWWAYALYALALVAIAASYWRYQELRVARLQEKNRLIAAEKDLELASAVQTMFLPSSPVLKGKNFDLCAFFRPADRCSGDFWWYEKSGDDGYWILVGDVTGHGAGPAVVTAAMGTALRLQTRLAGSPAALLDAGAHRPVGNGNGLGLGHRFSVPDRLAQVHAEISSLCGGSYDITTTSLEIDEASGHLRIYFTGGLPLYHIVADGRVSVVATGASSPIGVDPFEVGRMELDLKPGDRAILLTDGIPESFEGKRSARLLSKLFGESKSLPPEQAVKSIMAQVDGLRGGKSQQDDFTLILIDWRP